jgi:hypothetical protein
MDTTMSWASSVKLFVTGPRPKHRRRLAGVLVALPLLLPPAPGLAAEAADAGSQGQAAHALPGTLPSTDPANTKLPKITIKAAKEQVLRREVHRFVAAVVARPTDETLWRWNTPVCPLVAGFPQAFGEFILRRISNAAVDARAPLAGKVCHPNLFVIATNAPDLLLRKWLAREPLMYDSRNGFEPIKRFLSSKRPVRVWYNTDLGCEDGGPVNPGGTALAIASVPQSAAGPSFMVGAPTCTDGIDTHLNYADTRDIFSALVVIDGRQMKKVDIQQLADYIALVGLADVRLDVKPGTAPSILRLFTGYGTAPRGLTLWDRALLYSLYNTRQRNKQQLHSMESTMVRRIAR